MMPPIFFTFDEVVEMHRQQIERYGGSLGIRDRGLLESEIAQPQATFGGQLLHKDIFEMAAAYLFHLVQNHPFVDGNKRIGAAAALIFLFANQRDCHATNDQLTELVLNVAQGSADKGAIADFFREHDLPAQAP